MTLIPLPRKQSQTELCEVKASMVYKSEFYDSQGYTVKRYLKTKWNKTNAKTKRIQKTTISNDHKNVEYPKLLQIAGMNENSTAF